MKMLDFVKGAIADFHADGIPDGVITRDLVVTICANQSVIETR